LSGYVLKATDTILHTDSINTRTLVVTGNSLFNGINLGTSKSIVGTTAVTIGNNSQTVAINSSDWDVSATGAMTGMGAITSDGNILTTKKVTAGDSLCLGSFRFIIRLDTLCSLVGTDTLRIHPKR
jgi:hypothetical protein